MFSVVLLQSISTDKTIKPIVEIPFMDESFQKTFIGFEGEGVYKKAQLYGITTNNTIKKIPNFEFTLPKEDTNYFVSGLYGDISGEGQDDFILILTNPNSGTRIYTWTVDQNMQFSRLAKPYKIKNNQTESYPTSSMLSTIYPDKDKEIVISFGSPDRKTIILDYIGELKQTETIGKNFLANLAGPIILRTTDTNKDNLEDIYLLNNGSKIVESSYVSPTREKEETKIKEFKERVLDLFFYNTNNNVEKIFLLQNNKLFFEKWNKEIDISFKKPKKILTINNNILSIINKEGQIQHYEIKNKDKTIIKKNLITPIFKNKSFKTVHSLLLKDQKTVLLSHDQQSEILLQPLYYNIEKEEEKPKNKNIEKKENKTTEQEEILFPNTKEEEKSIVIKEEKKEEKEEKTIIKGPEKEPIIQQKILLTNDTIYVNINQKTNIQINLKPNYIFLDLKTKEKPPEMEFNIKEQSFEWVPNNKDLGFHKLQYEITYNKNLGMKKEEVDGALQITNETQKIKEIKNHTVFVNAPPSISTEKNNYKTHAEHQLSIPLIIKDKNKEQQLKITYSFKNGANKKLTNDSFLWKPKNTDFGEHKIKFFVFDGMLYDSTTAFIEVDTLKQEIINQNLITTTVNEEFIYQIPHEKQTKHTVIRGPQNLRISDEGEIHWIPINIQLGLNKITIETKGNNETYNYNMEIFVNAPPIISYRPNDVEFIAHNDTFNFQLQSFDQNEKQQLFWSLLKGPEKMKLNNAQITWPGEQLDYIKYTIELTDTIDNNIFHGKVYVNKPPALINDLPKYITLGETLNHPLKTKEENKTNPLNGKNEKHTKIKLLKKPKKMEMVNENIVWTPAINDIGEHEATLEISDGISTQETTFNIFVNDIPQITSTDSLRVQAGDTLKHILKAKDLNQNTNLIYSIRSNLKNMMLNAQSGEITWAPTIEDLGEHQISVNVTDGINPQKNNQTINIFVYTLPKFIQTPPQESYVNVEYNHSISAEDGFGKNEPGKDVYITIKHKSLENLLFNQENYSLSMVPTIEQTGSHEINLELKDNYGNTISKTFPINVLISPCESADSANYIKTEKLETKVKQYEKVIKIIESPQATIDTLYSINYNKRDLRKQKRQERRNKRKAKRLKQEPVFQDTLFVTEYDTIYNIQTDTLYNKIIEPKIIKEKKEINTQKENKTIKVEIEEEIKKPTVATKKETIVINKTETVLIDIKQELPPLPPGQKVHYKNNFEKQKWGQEGIKKTQKTKLETTLTNYKKGWK